MQKPVAKKHSFDVQVQSALTGTRIVPQAARSEGERNNLADAAPKSGQRSQPEARLVEKLIDFFKAMD